MTIKLTDTWRGPSRGTPDQAIAMFEKWGSFPIGQVSAAVKEIYRLCRLVGLDASLLVSHAAVETGSATSGKAFLSPAWALDRDETSTRNRYNIAGIGITDNYDFGYDFTGGLIAARAFVVHHARYELPADDPAWKHLEPYLHLDPRFDAVPAANRGTVRTVAQMTGKWWTNPTGAEALVSRGNSIFPNLPDQGEPPEQEKPVAKTYTTNVPGLPFGPITTTYPVTIHLIPASHTRQRPGIKARLPRRSVQHGTGNAKSMAAGEIKWLVEGQADGAQVSFNCCSDHLGVHVAVPYDEVTYQAADGSGPGNMNGASHEGIENEAMWVDPVKRKQAIYVMGDWQGQISARLDIANPEQHWTFNYNQPPSKRHDCPNKLRHIPGAWTAYVAQWTASYADELKRMGGIVTPPVGQTLALGDTVQVTERVNVRQAPGTGNAVLLVLTPDTPATISANPVTADGHTWYGVRGAFGSGWIAADWLVKIAAPAKPIDPAPIKALLGTDLEKNDTATGIVSDDNGTDFVFVADVIEVTAKDGLDVYLYADRATVLKHYDQGHRFIGAWLCKYGNDEASEQDWFYIEPEPLWGRVPYEGTKRIADAPLLPAEDSKQEAA